ncbi:RHS repeat domain-containing protein [Pseudoalteromonas aurantia]|uniref:Teneurin-like YD-shell domain-containing protein n=1 Tax=Pseudoalteromonas aurantia 208 TaxID=1314867 RepID=A0ABR9EAS1_9GAMM|nr:RHS repeat-associated core domain-containing protein [Pseudoalteromonas aurantia]MBE0368096.1 hypothetical protein [Pseudoalteromonas aurantia 208]
MKRYFIFFTILFSSSLFSFDEENLESARISQLQNINNAMSYRGSIGKIKPHSMEVFGEQHDKYSGTLTFTREDAVLKGNSNLPMSYKTIFHTYMPKSVAVWEEELPRIEMSFTASGSTKESALSVDWKNGSYCSGSPIPDRSNNIDADAVYSYSSVPRIIIPGIISDNLLLNDGTIGKSRENYKYVTKSNVIISCYVASDNKEGFKAILPNGHIYYFEYYRGKQSNSESSTYYTKDDYYYQVDATLYVVKVEDRFNNNLLYKYNNSRLESIVSNDGRKIEVSYATKTDSSTATRLSTKTVVATDIGGESKKSWVYTQEANGPGEHQRYVGKVVEPDLREWKYNLHVVDAEPGDLILASGSGTDSCILTHTTPRTMTVEHPDGGIAKFVFSEGFNDKANNYSYRGRIEPCYKVYSLDSKTIKNNQKTMTWKYEYSETRGAYNGSYNEGDVIPKEYLIPLPVPINVNRYLTKKVKEVNPDSSVNNYYINRDYSSFSEGDIVALEKEDSNGNIIKTEEYTYTPSTIFGKKYGVHLNGNRYNFLNNSLLKSEKHTFPDDVYNKDYIEYDIYGNAKEVKESNNFGADLKTSYFYYHDTSNWLLSNFIKKSRVEVYDGVETEYKPEKEVSYYSAEHVYSSLPHEIKLNDQLRLTYTKYHDDGNLKEVEYNKDVMNGNVKISTVFSNYYRSIPQKVTLSNRYEGTENLSLSRTVDEFGRITSITDFNGVKTNYQFDKQDRLISIKEDGSLDTFFTWVHATTDSNKNIRIVSRCELKEDHSSCEGDAIFKTTETYDNLLRLVSTENEDLTNPKELKSVRYQYFAYDHNNKQTFASHVTDSASIITSGVYRNYDVLGRVEKISTTGLGDVVYEYLVDNKIKVTDAQGNATTTTYQAFGRPRYDIATKIESPENITTDIDVDIFGLVKSITQSGEQETFTETRLYDANKQLCLIQRADVGNTVMKYNALGELQWQKQGVTNTECVTTEPADSTSFIYDNVGDLYKVDYPGTDIDVEYTLDNNGNIKKLVAGTVTHAYNYNNQNLLEDETLTVGSDGTLTIDYDYNSLGHRSAITYPDNTKVQFKPNGFGEPTEAQVYDAGDVVQQSFAIDAVHYAHGALKTFTYGNGVKHTTTVNTSSLLPESIVDLQGTTNIVNLGYTYDNNLNITSITDTQNPQFSITNMTYDGVDRLKTVTGVAGIGNSAITYDTLGNIKTYKSKGRDLTYKYDTSLNRLTSVTGTGTDGKYAVIKYDARGHIKHNGKFDLNFNAANQLKSAKGNTYIYDGHNRRVKQVDGKGTSYSMYSQYGTLLYREKGSFIGEGTSYIHLGKKLIAKYGDVTPQTVAESRQHHRPFGESIEAPKDDVGYTGHKFDTDLGLSYMQARYYDPVIGRFYSNDPVDTIGHVANGNTIHGFNRYIYANNNPYKYKDPNGELGHLAVGFIIGAGVELGAQYFSGKDISFTKAAVAGAAGAATGGITSIAKASIMTGSKVVATATEKALSGTMVLGGGAVANTGAGMVNDSIDGASNEKIMENGLENAVEGVAPHVKAVGKVAGKLSGKLFDKIGMGDAAKQIGVEAATQGSEKAISEACSSVDNEC